mmetsp:Transcript_28249/g.43458  ORF Transcript_28249/g.43458 Transcript_28249/m.43458 type:complete len:86 (+) Transcript_28249:165-422(+)|eukprot:CAMPEP_0118706730 /NCGR_PEP_ID=MMETSP0800-20121206/20739_1 /TAXON_ID=210618 ORGANISM="Striatella unipunctata, Strain CCMP2910" /NCGR_SAMPLE_ID=MMETSP0800 /ASSEMBLY_ACC=CAM_ASM_000638 /LENGTH=85 /DNA_ID=CAMNT_0006609335 /DNA_START=159 /DNA_END=416 /DNA_ORIENTATION=+
MVKFDGHELAVIGTATGVIGVVDGCFGRGWAKSFIHRQPIAAMSCALFGIGILLPLTVVPIRRRMGLPTNQYDGQYWGATNPALE